MNKKDVWIGEINVSIVGMQFHCRVENDIGSRIQLVREPSNPKDEYAIQVYTSAGDLIGYIDKKYAAILSPILIKEEVHVECINVEHISPFITDCLCSISFWGNAMNSMAAVRCPYVGCPFQWCGLNHFVSTASEFCIPCNNGFGNGYCGCLDRDAYRDDYYEDFNAEFCADEDFMDYMNILDGKSEADPEKYVNIYRVLSNDDLERIDEDEDLVAKDLNAARKPLEHAFNGSYRNSQYISASLDFESAKKFALYYPGPKIIAEIMVERSSLIYLTRGQYQNLPWPVNGRKPSIFGALNNKDELDRARNFANGFQEVLVLKSVPRYKIVRVEEITFD